MECDSAYAEITDFLNMNFHKLKKKSANKNNGCLKI